MPFWPFYMLAVAGLAVLGYRAGAWIAPVALLAGLFGMRAILWGFDPALYEVAACTLWLCIAVLLAYNKAWVAAFFICLSGLSYGVLFVGGLRIGYLELLSGVADVFFWLAVITIGGGLWARSGHHRRSGAGFRDRFAGVALGMAARQARGSVTVAQRPEMIYDTR